MTYFNLQKITHLNLLKKELLNSYCEFSPPPPPPKKKVLQQIARHKQAKTESGKTPSDEELPWYEVSEKNFRFDKTAVAHR